MSALDTGNGILFMKVGTHARENLKDILERKQKEIEDGGYAMWGYGGNTCHPLTMVRPFANDFKKAGSVIRLVMEEMESKHFAEQIPADEYSIDGVEWVTINKQIHKVLGSRYALFINNLHHEEFDLPLSKTQVAVGPSEGVRGDTYIQGRVDKACLIVEEGSIIGSIKPRPIKLVADIVAPYAALLRNKT